METLHIYIKKYHLLPYYMWRPANKVLQNHLWKTLMEGSIWILMYVKLNKWSTFYTYTIIATKTSIIYFLVFGQSLNISTLKIFLLARVHSGLQSSFAITILLILWCLVKVSKSKSQLGLHFETCLFSEVCSTFSNHSNFGAQTKVKLNVPKLTLYQLGSVRKASE